MRTLLRVRKRRAERMTFESCGVRSTTVPQPLLAHKQRSNAKMIIEPHLVVALQFSFMPRTHPNFGVLKLHLFFTSDMSHED